MSRLIVLGSHNRKKLRELEELLVPHGIELKTLADFPSAIEVAETGTTFAENARLKAIEQAKHLGHWVLGEDSGLSVEALGGAPGVYSARFSDPGATDERNNALLLEKLVAVSFNNRWAFYTCHAALSDPQGNIRAESVGTCRGRILSTPAGTGGFGYGPLEPFRDHLTIISNTDVANANATEAREIGGDHFRSTAVFLTQSYPKRTDGPDIEAGTSLDQIYAQRLGRSTPIPSMQMCIEGVDRAGGCQYGYSCSYVDSLSWAGPNQPLPMVRNPRVVFDELLGVFGTGTTAEERRERLAENRSLLDWVVASTARLKRSLGPADRRRLDDYLESVRQIERRIQIVEAQNRSGEIREWPAAPAGIPDSFADHVKLMFDLQLLAFKSDITRVFSLKLSRDGSNRTYPESGYKGPFHDTSHHGNREERILELARINTYHVGMLPYFIEQLKQTPDGDRTLLDNTLVMYGSPMGDPNLHNHKKVPFILLGHAGGSIKGGTHIKAPNRTPLANAMLSALQALGLDDVQTFGDSEGAMSLS